MILAVNPQTALGFGIAAALVAGWLVYLIAHLRTRVSERPAGYEIEMAPNRRPYFDDEGLEGRRLEQVLGWALVLLVIVGAGLPLYWLREPGRQTGAVRGFDHRSAARGRIMFETTDSPEPEGNIGHFGCARCHGASGEGGVASYVLPGTTPPKQVKWAAPALNTVLFRFDEDEVRTIIVYGRPNTPMPPWGVEGGGAMNDQQVGDLIDYLKSIQLDPADVQREAVEKYGTDGAQLFDAYCSRCHTKGWSYGEPDVIGGGALGPNLTGGATLRQFPDIEGQIDFVTKGSDFEKPYGVRGIGTGRMPGFGVNDEAKTRKTGMLTPAQIRAIVEYERGL